MGLRGWVATFVVLAAAAVASADNMAVLTNDDIINEMGSLWGDAAVVSANDLGADGVEFTVTFESFTPDGSAESNLPYGTDNAAESGDLSVGADWTGYDGYAVEFTFVSTTATGGGTLEAELFLNDSQWGWFQPPRPSWPVFSEGESSVIYWDLANDPSFAGGSFGSTQRVGFQVITKDMPGETVVFRVKGTEVPEPTTLVALCGLGGLQVLRRRRR